MFSRDVLRLDCAATVEEISAGIRRIALGELRRRGAVVGMSGGIDSSVVAALCARALGPERVLGLFMPEHDSADDSLHFGQLVAEKIGIRTETVRLGPALEALGCYRYRDEAIRRLFPEYGPGWKSKIVLPEIADKPRFNVFSLIVQAPDGNVQRAQLPLDAYLQIVAASNMKQRTRKLTEYFHAERLNYAVAGTPNRLEYDQGFFVKYGDGAADFKPIAHLYKSQVYELAGFLDLPLEVRSRPPTTDTYSMPQTQEEFYFSLPYDKMDLCLWARNHSVPPEECAPVVGLTAAQVEQVYRDIDAKRRTTRFLHLAPILIEKIPELALG
jgi:NAD+ synthase